MQFWTFKLIGSLHGHGGPSNRKLDLEGEPSFNNIKQNSSNKYNLDIKCSYLIIL